MERKEENIENIMRRISIQSSSLSKPTSSLPLDLVQGILLNLLAKSIVRFRCVSKLWSSITTDPYFINSFGTKSSTQPSLLTFFKKRDKLFVFSFPQHHQNTNETNCSSQPLDSYQKKYTKYCSFGITSITESVHGLICFQNLAQRIVWNPSMRQFLALPKPKPECKDTTILFLGYDPIEGQHKVVCMPTDETCHECWVLTLRSAQESWRTVKTNHKHLVFPSSYGRCINGVLYYSAYSGDMDFSIIVMSFDVRSEKLEMIKLPSEIKRCMLIPYQGKLASFDNNVTKRGIKLWILEDAEEHRWSCKHFNAPLVYYDRSLETDFKLDGITHAGELIYVPFKFFKSFSILYFDPDRDSFRKVEFKGIVDREFRRRNGLGNSRLHTFPNHIDTLMSL